MFLIFKGQFRIEYQDRPTVELSAGAFHIVPRGVMPNPVCAVECLIMLIEPTGPRHTGDLIIDSTVFIEVQLG